MRDQPAGPPGRTITGSTICDEPLATGRTAHERRVAASYDEVLLDVAVRVQAARSIGKSDIGALLLWKRLRADTLTLRSQGPRSGGP